MKRAVRENFDASAAAYAAYEERTGRFRALAAALGDRMETAHGGPFARLLDAGAGTGASTRPLAARAASLVAFDASPGMLAANPAPDRVLGDFDRLPFRDGSFDAVAFTASLFLVPDPSLAANEARRVLGPGGVVGAVALEGWFTGEESAFVGLGRESRSPSDPAAVKDALDNHFAVETGTLAFESSADDVRVFHEIPAIAARFFPRDPTAERVRKVQRLLAPLEGTFEQRWRWVVGTREA